MNIFKNINAPVILLFCLGLFLFGSNLSAQRIPDRPKPAKLVNDLANVFSSSQNKRLENKLEASWKETGVQMTVVTVKSLNGQDPSTLANAIGESWGVGDKAFDNGIVLLVAPNDRKVTIATGYGVEGVLPDVLANRIIQEEILPRFKKDDYYGGVDKGTTKVTGYVSGEYEPPAAHTLTGESGFSIPPEVIFMLALFFGIILFTMLRGNNNNRPPTTYTGDGKEYKVPRRRRRSPWGRTIVGGGHQWRDFSRGRGGFGFPTGGGSRRSGGSSSGGGGGFGGFGGGSFGGGGATGSW